MKKLKIFVSIITVVFCMFSLSSCKYKYILAPATEVNEELPANMTSSASMAEYARNIVEEDWGKEFEIGSVRMTLDLELKGEVKVTLVEKDKKKPMIVFVDFDTKNNKLLRFNYAGRDSKLHPGFIDIQNWKIDYAEAIEIAKELHSKTEGFRYDDITIESCNPYPYEAEDGEFWSVLLYDFQSTTHYNTHIDPYTGEVIGHGNWDSKLFE